MLPDVLSEVSVRVTDNDLVKGYRRGCHKELSVHNFIAVAIKGDKLQVLVAKLRRDGHGHNYIIGGCSAVQRRKNLVAARTTACSPSPPFRSATASAALVRTTNQVYRSKGADAVIDALPRCRPGTTIAFGCASRAY